MNRNESHHPEDLTSVDGIIKALYESVSFSPGRQPNFERLRTLFHPGGRLVPPRGEKDSATSVMDLETFIARSREHVVISGLERKGFSETEVARRTHSFGNIAHLFSTYESRHLPTDPAPMQRGINSIQLLREQGRWWVISIAWDIERPGNPVPRPYLT